MCWWVKTKSASLPERPCEQLTYCAKNESVQWDYINRVAKRHNCRITGKTKATRYGGPSTQATRYPQRMSITNNATFAAGGQCDQSNLVRSKVCNESFFLRSLRNFSRANEQGANLSDSCSIFLRRLFRVGDNVLVNSLSVIVLPCIAMRRSYSHHGADSDYSDSLAFRRCSYFNLRPQASKTHAEKLALGLVNFSCSTLASIPSISSCGNRIFFFADLLFVLPLDIDAPHLNGLYGRTQYSKKNEMLSIDMCAHMILICAHSLSFVTQIKQRPAVLATHAGRLTTNDSESIEVAMRNHTQTKPEFIYTFTALHRDRMADGVTTVHVAADTLVDAHRMVKEMGYVAAFWKGREENTLFIQKCENNFIWRFIALSTAQPRVITIEATSEQEARQQSPAGCVMVFAARIRQEVRHVQ